MTHRENGMATLNDVQKSRQLLQQIGPGDNPVALVQALEPSMSVAAALLMVVKPGRTLSVTHHALRLPQELLDGWMRTPPAYFEQSLLYAVRSRSGDFWQGNQDFSAQLRQGLEVMAEMDGFGLGDGAGLKIDEHPTAGGGVEHVALAVMTERGEPFPRCTTEVCQALAPDLRNAVFRLNLPFTRGNSIHAQMLDEDEVGFVCLNGRDGEIIEVNQRAYNLALRYRAVAGLRSTGEFSMREFVRRAVTNTRGDKRWQLVHPDGLGRMQVRAYSLLREQFGLAYDLPMLKLEEWTWEPPCVDEFVLPPEFHMLTARQYEIAMLLVVEGHVPKQIALELRIAESTVRKHIENIYRKLRVHSKSEAIRKSRERGWLN